MTASPSPLRRPRVREIQRLVAAHFLLPLNDFDGHSRQQRIVVPRSISMLLCVKYTTMSCAGIARLHNRHHTTMLSGMRKVAARLADGNSPLCRHVAALEGKLQDNYVVFPPVLRAPRIVLAEERRQIALMTAAAVG